jgi:creatinine amidohydrolase
MELPVEPHSALINCALESLAEQGFRRIVVWRGCEGCDLQGVVDNFNRRVGPGVRAFLPDQPYQEVWRRIGEPGLAGEYSDRFITTLAQYLWPDAVHADQSRGDELMAVAAGGSPTAPLEAVKARPIPDASSTELGAQLWFATTELVTLTLKIAAETPLDMEEGDGRGSQ